MNLCLAELYGYGSTPGNSTGLSGVFDFDLIIDYPPTRQVPELLGHPSGDASQLFHAVQDQLGHDLMPQNGSVDMLVIVIDHVEEPSEN